MQNSTMDLFEGSFLSEHPEKHTVRDLPCISMSNPDAEKLRHLLDNLFSISMSPQNEKHLRVEIDHSWVDASLDLASSISQTEDQKRVIKVRKLPQLTVIGLFDSEIGSAVVTQVRRHRQCFATLETSVFKHSFFTASYLDDVGEIRLPYEIWMNAYCGDKLATEPDKVIGVPIVTCRGRRFVISSTLSGTDYHEANAWALSPTSCTAYAPRTYGQLIKQMDVEERERGDLRGLAVKVNGTVCVLDSLHKFVDDRC
jgi:hypothetical protein